MAELTESLGRLIQEFSRLPGIGRKSAERIAYYLLRQSTEEAMKLADAIRAVKENVRYCRVCYNLSEEELCSICRGRNRRRDILCIVEQPRDLVAIEQTGRYDGLYHVLLGRINPSDGTTADQLTIDALIERVRVSRQKSVGGSRSGSDAEQVPIREVIMATNPTTDGDGTAFYISNRLTELTSESAIDPLRVTRLARGITSGSVLEFANREILTDALVGRQIF